MIRYLCMKIKNWYLQTIQGFGWLTGSTWRILLFLLLCLCVIVFSAWHTERVICYVFGIQHTFGCTYFLFILCGLVLMMHETEYSWHQEWVRIPVGLLSVFMLYYCVLALVWLMFVGIFGLPINVDSYGTIFILICTCLIVLIGFVNTKTIRVVSHSLPMPGIQKPYHIVLISDIHLGTFIKSGHVQRIVNAINKIRPDIVIIAGDLIDNDGSSPQNDIEVSRVAHQLRNILSPDGVILTLGNHDPVASNEYFLSFLQESNIKLLNNEVAEYPDFYIIGRTDPSRNLRKPIDDLICKCTKQKLCIIVDHDPQYIDEAICCGADLVLSGHTHAGQFFPASTAVRFVLGKEKFYGYHLIDKTHCIISAGAGVFNLPVRIGTRNEIVDITLEPILIHRNYANRPQLEKDEETITAFSDFADRRLSINHMKQERGRLEKQEWS